MKWDSISKMQFWTDGCKEVGIGNCKITRHSRMRERDRDRDRDREAERERWKFSKENVKTYKEF